MRFSGRLRSHLRSSYPACTSLLAGGNPAYAIVNDVWQSRSVRRLHLSGLRRCLTTHASVWVWPASDGILRASPAEAHVELLAKYTDDDIHNLMAYLQTLR